MSTRTRRTQQARAERRDDIRQALLLSIEELVAEGLALSDVTVERMARRAGISRAKFYVYFEDRADVLSAWFDTVTAQLRATTAAWWQIDARSTPADLRAAFEPMLGAYRPHLTLLRAVHDTALYDVMLREQLEAFMALQVGDLARHIRVGQRAGFVCTALPANETASWLALMAERMQHAIGADASDAQLRRHLDTYVDIVWHTLYA